MHIEVTLHNTMEINKINFENNLIEWGVKHKQKH